MATVTIIHTTRRGLVTRPLMVATKLATVPATWVKRMRERRELAALLAQPDYIFKDLGVMRHDVTQEAMKPFWRA